MSLQSNTDPRLLLHSSQLALFLHLSLFHSDCYVTQERSDTPSAIFLQQQLFIRHDVTKLLVTARSSLKPSLKAAKKSYPKTAAFLEKVRENWNRFLASQREATRIFFYQVTPLSKAFLEKTSYSGIHEMPRSAWHPKVYWRVNNP